MNPPRSLRDLAGPALEVLLAIAVGALVYLGSCLLLPPAARATGFGEVWQRMSQAPLALAGDLPHRLLAPLLAWSCGLGGERFVAFTRGLSVLLLAVVFLYCRQRGNARLDALLVAIAAGISGAVQMYKQHWVGYVDDLSYALFLLAAMAVRRPALFWTLWLLNLLNHELALFLLPWLCWLRREVGAAWRHDLIGAGAALAAYAGFYLYVHVSAPAQVYDAGYFAQHALLPWATLWLCILALVQWLATFGPWLAVLGWHQHRSDSGRERLQLWLVLAAVAAIFAVAFDFSRHANLLLLPLVLASSRMLAAGRRREFAVLLLAAGVYLALLSPWRPEAWPVGWFWDHTLRCGAVVDYGKVVTCLLPQTWPAVLLAVAAAAALYGLGWWLARRR